MQANELIVRQVAVERLNRPVAIAVGGGRFHHRRRGRQADQVERRPANPLRPRRGTNRPQAALFLRSQKKPIEVLDGPIGLANLGQRMHARLLKRPKRPALINDLLGVGRLAASAVESGGKKRGERNHRMSHERLHLIRIAYGRMGG